jgi:2-octaprenyl-6-methoxyphenol hydroxylase
MRLIDDTGRIFRAPSITFEAGELGLEAFGQNIDNADLIEVLFNHARHVDNLVIIEQQVTDFSHHLISAGGQEIAASLVVAADGRESLIRSKACFTVKRSPYPQEAVTAFLSHTQPHENISTEFHTAHGPFTLVPMQGDCSSLVWMTTSEKAADLSALSDAAFAAAVFKQSRGILGNITLAGARGRTSLIGLSVSSYAKDNVALIGEAAHAFPPIGAQGLNLGLRDVAALRDTLVDARTAGKSAAYGLKLYDRGRKLDVPLRKGAVDALNKSLIADFFPLDMARMTGMTFLKHIKSLRRFVMKEGLRPSFNLPRLMQDNVMKKDIFPKLEKYT